MTRYVVTMTVVDPDVKHTVIVTAADEWKARTVAMFDFPAQLRGQHVAFSVRECGCDEPFTEDSYLCNSCEADELMRLIAFDPAVPDDENDDDKEGTTP